jgi:hypothetical protein
MHMTHQWEGSSPYIKLRHRITTQGQKPGSKATHLHPRFARPLPGPISGLCPLSSGQPPRPGTSSTDPGPSNSKPSTVCRAGESQGRPSQIQRLASTAPMPHHRYTLEGTNSLLFCTPGATHFEDRLVLIASGSGRTGSACRTEPGKSGSKSGQ